MRKPQSGNMSVSIVMFGQRLTARQSVTPVIGSTPQFAPIAIGVVVVDAVPLSGEVAVEAGAPESGEPVERSTQPATKRQASDALRAYGSAHDTRERKIRMARQALSHCARQGQVIEARVVGYGPDGHGSAPHAFTMSVDPLTKQG